MEDYTQEYSIEFCIAMNSNWEDSDLMWSIVDYI